MIRFQKMTMKTDSDKIVLATNMAAADLQPTQSTSLSKEPDLGRRKKAFIALSVFNICYLVGLTVAVIILFLRMQPHDVAEVAEVRTKPAPVGVTNFIGVGYNILDGNPEGGDLVSGGVDPGFLVSRPILKLTYSNALVTSDLEYQVPDQVVFSPRSSCVMTSSQQTVFGMSSYVKKFSLDVGASASVNAWFVDVQFAASTRYRSMKRNVESHNTVFYEERTVCNRGQARYRTELAMEEQYPLDNGFVADACELPLSYDEDSYMLFLNKWGTHVVTRVDLGIKTTDRYEEARDKFVQYASRHVQASVSVDVRVLRYKAGLYVDTSKFNSGLKSGMTFGNKSHTFTVGGDNMPEPISVFLIGMHEVFDEEYWQAFRNYVNNGLCESNWIDSLSRVKTNFEIALQNYSRWRHVFGSSDPRIGIPIAWPKGTYALPMPDTGCPNAHFNWTVGYRYQDTYSSNRMSSSLHLFGSQRSSDLYRYFCSKTHANEDIYGWTFQPGQYCINKKGQSCPAGFDEGSILWKDSSSSNVRGAVPEGVYNRDTKIYYCCREDGFASIPIYLPTEDPFYLLKKNHQCQEVHGMTSIEEFFIWDTASASNRFTGSHPWPGRYGNDVKLEFCYYEPKTV